MVTQNKNNIMALNINTPITTDEGFIVDNAFAYLNIYILAPSSNWANVSYFKSQDDWETGKAPLNVNYLPSVIQTELTNQEFWGTQLAIVIHEKSLLQIEQITGPGTITINTGQV